MAATSPSASPPVATATASGRPHPSYTKMITQALAELGGTSGRAAIAAFILGRFTGLPATHDALLSAHLRRLVAEGVVRIYGSKLRACYVFPASDTRGRGRPRKAATRLPKNLNLDDDSSGSGSDDDDMIWPAPLASCVNPDWDPNSAGRNSGSQPQQNSVPNLDGFQSNTSDDDVVAYSGEHDDDDEYTPARAYGNRGRGHRKVNLSANGDASSVTKRGRGRPRKLQKDGPSPSPGGGDTSTGIKRGRGRPRKEEQQSQAKHPPTPPASRRFKVGCGRPMLAPTSGDTGPPRSWRPIIIEKLPPARWSVDPPAASAGVKRPRGRPRMYRPMPAKTGDELENPVSVGVALENPISVDVALENPISVDVALENPRMHKPSAGDIVSMLRKEQLDFETEMPAAAMPAEAGDARSVEAGDATRAEAGDARSVEAGDAIPAKAGDATPAEAGDAIPAKAGDARPAEAGDARPAEAGDARPAEAGHATPAETGGAASAGIKRPRGRPRKEKPAAAMSAQAGDAASAGIKRGRGRPRKEKPDSASAGIKRGRERPRKYNPATEDGDAVSTGMKGPLENPIRRPSARDIVSMVMNRECGPAFETWFGDMTEASRRKQQEEEGREKTTSTRPMVEEEKAGGCVFGTGSGGMFANNRAKKKAS